MTTSIAASTAPDVVVDVAAEPDAIQVDFRPARQAPEPESGPDQHPAALRYAQFRTVDPGAVQQFFAAAYTPSWRVSGLSSRSAVTHRRCAAASMTVDEVLIQGRLGLEIPSADTVVVIQPRAGSLNVTGGPFPDADSPVLVAHSMSCALRVNGARFDVVTIAADVLHKIAANCHPPLPQQIRFLSWSGP